MARTRTWRPSFSRAWRRSDWSMFPTREQRRPSPISSQATSRCRRPVSRRSCSTCARRPTACNRRHQHAPGRRSAGGSHDRRIGAARLRVGAMVRHARTCRDTARHPDAPAQGKRRDTAHARRRRACSPRRIGSCRGHTRRVRRTSQSGTARNGPGSLRPPASSPSETAIVRLKRACRPSSRIASTFSNAHIGLDAAASAALRNLRRRGA